MSQRNYLTLGERLSQIYLNYYTICITIIIVKVHLFKNSVVDQLQTFASVNLCNGTDTSEKFSDFVNGLIIRNLNKLKSTNLYFIEMLISVIKNMILFYIEIFLGTYTCLLNAIISGTANFAVDASEQVIVGVNQTIVLVANDIEDGLSGLSNVINQLISGVSAIKNFFTGSGVNNGSEYTNKINLSVSALKNISIPGSVLTDIQNFKNNTLPNFTNLENSTQALISLPFQVLEKNLNNSLINTENLFATDSLPVLNVSNPFCENYINSEQFSESLIKAVEMAAKIIIILLVVFATILTLAIVIQEWNKIRHENRLVYELNGTPALRSRTTVNNILNLYDHKFIYYLQKWRIVKSNRALWLISYITSSPAKIILLAGFSGLVMVLLQYLILQRLQSISKNFTNSISKVVLDPSDFKQATEDYVNQTNAFINLHCDQLNVELFGNIKQVSLAINSTLNTFWGDLNGTLNSIFGKTPFATPINTVVYCTIGRKIIKLEEGLTWINQHLSINLPPLNDTDFDNINLFLVNDQSAVTSYIEKGINGVINIQQKALQLELIISLIFLAIWLLQIIIGIVILFIRHHMSRRESEKFAMPKLQSTFSSNVISLETISSPIPLTNEQRREYGYALSNPLETMVKSSYKTT